MKDASFPFEFQSAFCCAILHCIVLYLHHPNAIFLPRTKDLAKGLSDLVHAPSVEALRPTKAGGTTGDVATGIQIRAAWNLNVICAKLRVRCHSDM